MIANTNEYEGIKSLTIELDSSNLDSINQINIKEIPFGKIYLESSDYYHDIYYDSLIFLGNKVTIPLLNIKQKVWIKMKETTKFSYVVLAEDNSSKLYDSTFKLDPNDSIIVNIPVCDLFFYAFKNQNKTKTERYKTRISKDYLLENSTIELNHDLSHINEVINCAELFEYTIPHRFKTELSVLQFSRLELFTGDSKEPGRRNSNIIYDLGLAILTPVNFDFYANLNTIFSAELADYNFGAKYTNYSFSSKNIYFSGSFKYTNKDRNSIYTFPGESFTIGSGIEYHSRIWGFGVIPSFFSGKIKSEDNTNIAESGFSKKDNALMLNSWISYKFENQDFYIRLNTKPYFFTNYSNVLVGRVKCHL